MFHHRLSRGSDRGCRDCRLEFQSRWHHKDADGRLYRGSEAEGRSCIAPAVLSDCAWLLRPHQRDVANAVDRNELLHSFVEHAMPALRCMTKQQPTCLVEGD